ncbi:MAG TPA: ATP-binding protein [Chloroflexaceae bacterium]|nr:ATP-binding protein [Chloroflexaceae bacterium]
MNARPPEVVRFDLPARYTYLHLLGDCIASMLKLVDGIVDAEMLVYNIQLAAHEACTNIVNHAYGNTGEGRIVITIALHFDPPRLTIELQDTGRPFEPEKYTSPNLDEVRIHGYGLFLIRNLMDSVSYTPSAGRNLWCLTKELNVEGM